MSEPSSFFSKIHIKKSRLKEFLNAAPAITKTQDGWADWWNSHDMYGKTPFTLECLNEYSDSTNKDIIDAWSAADQAYAFSDYDEQEEIWYFGIVFFTENYYEMIPMISALRGVEVYKEHHDEDFILIYSYFWNQDSVHAYLKFNGSKSVFSKNPSQDALIATEYLRHVRL